MTRIILLVLALLEMAAGVFGLVAVAGLFSLHDVGMLTSFWPVLAIAVLLLGAAAAIFVRRPWSYWLHIVTVLLAGALYAFFVGPLFGVGTLPPWLQAALVVAPLTVIFFLPPVHRFFGV